MSRVKSKQKAIRVKAKEPKQKPVNMLARRMGLTGKNRAILNSK